MPEAAHGQGDWQDGWWRRARRVDSPNFGPRPPDTEVDLVVVHSISLPPGTYGGSAVEDLFLNQLDAAAHPYFQTLAGLTVSAHFFIRRDGEVVQFVACQDRAWHAGRSVWQGRVECNDYSVGIELEGLEGDVFEPAQYSALTQLVQALAQVLPIQGLAGHEHVAPGRKADPGPGFDWDRLRASLAWPAERFPAA